MIPQSLCPLANHLWQSTLFAGAAWLLTLALRKNSARVRHWVWVVASLKFLVPFSTLIAIGGRFELRTAPAIAPKVSVVVEQVSQPFTVTTVSLPMSATAPTAPNLFPAILFGIWACGFIGISISWFVRWRRIRGAVRTASPVQLDIPIKAISSPTLLEPGVFGAFRPILLLPEGITERLTPAQLKAVVAHELCHVHHWDNLIATVHMFVETVFWFHPLVWWIGKRMVEERELSCDEEVLLTTGEPRIYAEGILRVCKLYVESPLECVSGVTGGSNLKNRIEAILSNRTALKLNFRKMLALTVSGMAALAVPIVVGMMNAPAIRAQSEPRPKFEVASIRACSEPLNDGGPHSSPGRLATDCAQLLNLIGNAYNALADGHLNLNAEPAPITGGPPWIHSASYDINAKAEGNPSKEMMLGPMMQALLEDRFQLKIHRQTTEGPVYFLTVARGGSKLQPSEGNCTLYYGVPRPPLAPGQKYCERMISGIKPSVQADDATLDEFSKMLRMVVGRPVINKTGITGQFDMRVEFSREGTELAAIHLIGPSPAPDPTGPPSIFTALEEQLGLRLESGKGPVDRWSSIT